MPEKHWDGPLLSLKFSTIEKISQIDEDEILSFWNLSTKCKNSLENGQRLENISWRLWYRSRSFNESANSTTAETKANGVNADAKECVGLSESSQPSDKETLAMVELVSPKSKPVVFQHIKKSSSPIVSTSSFKKLLSALDWKPGEQLSSSNTLKNAQRPAAPQGVAIMLGSESRLVDAGEGPPCLLSSLALPQSAYLCSEDAVTESSAPHSFDLTREQPKSRTCPKSKSRASLLSYLDSLRSFDSSIEESDYDSLSDSDCSVFHDYKPPINKPLFQKVNVTVRLEQVRNRPSLLSSGLKAYMQSKSAIPRENSSSPSHSLHSSKQGVRSLEAARTSNISISPLMYDTSYNMVGW